jgi:superfamily II DNA or RNA helicase
MSVIQSIKCEGVNWFKDFPYISAKTGTGKTTTAVLELRDYLEEHNNLKIDKVILLTPYKRTRKQVLADSRFAGNVRYLDYNLLRSSAFQSRIEETIFSTYAGLCNALKDDLITLDGCLLIFDELHTFLDFTRYQPQMSYLLEWILTPELWERFIAVGMTGTP